MSVTMASVSMMPLSPQDPATQINTFKSYVTLIADPIPGSEYTLFLYLSACILVILKVNVYHLSF